MSGRLGLLWSYSNLGTSVCTRGQQQWEPVATSRQLLAGSCFSLLALDF